MPQKQQLECHSVMTGGLGKSPPLNLFLFMLVKKNGHQIEIQ
jgi:hypothetical protein